MSKGFASNARMTLVAAGVFACFLSVAVRLVFLHVVDREALLRFVERARRQIVVEQARRGAILDTKGNLLATSRSESTLAVDPWNAAEYVALEKDPVRREKRRLEEVAKRERLAALLHRPAAEIESIFTARLRPVSLADDTDGAADGVAKVRWVK